MLWAHGLHLGSLCSPDRTSPAWNRTSLLFTGSLSSLCFCKFSKTLVQTHLFGLFCLQQVKSAEGHGPSRAPSSIRTPRSRPFLHTWILTHFLGEWEGEGLTRSTQIWKMESFSALQKCTCLQPHLPNPPLLPSLPTRFDLEPLYFSTHPPAPQTLISLASFFGLWSNHLENERESDRPRGASKIQAGTPG